VKTRPLPDLDLARIASLPEGLRRKALEQMQRGRPPFSYAPLRSCFHDILNVQPEMFGPAGHTEWSLVADLIQRKSRSEDELKANLAVARGLHAFAATENLFGRAQDFFPMAMGAAQKVSYWQSMILSFGGRAFVPFFDPRRSRGLNRESRRFVFSMMHEHIRISDPDYEDVGLVIFQFGECIDDCRAPRMYTDEGVPLYPHDVLEEMVGSTYSLWHDVCQERDADERRKGTGTSGPLI
jgi:hypothetical protein